jgi:hypothetical protein
MVVNVGSFTPGAALLPDTLWVVEQIPGLVVGGDVTQELERGYFPSYNVPYWPAIYNLSGYASMIEKHVRNPRAPGALGDLAGISYQLAPRAQIFRRDQGNVVDMPSMQAIMRYNNYKNDPYSGGACASGGVPLACLCFDIAAARRVPRAVRSVRRATLPLCWWFVHWPCC